MDRHPLELVTPVFHWLDWVIAEYGLYIYLVAVWASPFLIAWILRGGFWRTRPRPRSAAVRRIMTPSSAVPPPLPRNIEGSPPSLQTSDGDVQSFGA